jgi:hypothetical protein
MKTSFLIAIFAIILLTGCTQETTTDFDKNPYIGGTNGLILTFRENAPPSEVFDGGEDPFDIVVNLKNEGEFNIPAGGAHLRVSGIQATEFGKTDSNLHQTLNYEIAGKIKDSEGNVIQGGYEDVEFVDLNKIGSLPGTMTYPLRVDVCYLYGGMATSKLCYKKDLRSTDNKICSVTGTKQVFNSGQPVHISELTQYVKGTNSIGFTFKVIRAGNGEIFMDTLTNCEDATHQNKDRVFVSVDTGEQGLECRGLRDGTATQGYVRLASGEAIVSCDQPANVGSDFQKPLTISLRYRYREDVFTHLVVKHSPE